MFYKNSCFQILASYLLFSNFSSTYSTTLKAPCLANSECADDVVNSECKPSAGLPFLKFCECAADFFETKDLDFCQKYPEFIGDDCHADIGVCPVDNSTCRPSNVKGLNADPDGYGKCQCDDKFFVERGTNDSCIPFPDNLDEECKVEEPALDINVCENIEHAICQNSTDDGYGTCVCDDVSFQFNNLCKVKPQSLGDDCNSTLADCLFPNSECKAEDNPEEGYEGVCVCMQNFEEINGACQRNVSASLGEACLFSEECIVDFSICDLGSVNKICICNATYSKSPDRKDICFATKLDLECTKNEQCQLLGESLCDPDDKLCKCDGDKSIPNTGNDKCLEKATAVGDNCEETLQCLVFDGNSTCNSDLNRCDCKTGFVPSDDKLRCYPALSFDEPCDTDQDFQCRGSDDFLTCMEDPVGGRINATCQCVNGYLWIQKPTTAACFKIVNVLEEECKFTEQCEAGMGPRSNCVPYTTGSPTKVCKCTSEAAYSPWDKYCYIPHKLDARCEETGECQVGVSYFTTCSKTTSFPSCQCVTDAIEWKDSCYEEKILGDQCQNEEECTVPIRGESTCDPLTKRCTCKLGNYQDFGQTQCTSGAFMVQGTSFISLVALLTTALFSKFSK